MKMILLPLLLCSSIYAQLPESMQQFGQSMAPAKVPGMIIAVIDGEKESYHSFGNFDDPYGTRDVPAGGITHVITAAILSDMVLNGTVQLDDPVRKYLPGYEFPVFQDVVCNPAPVFHPLPTDKEHDFEEVVCLPLPGSVPEEITLCNLVNYASALSPKADAGRKISPFRTSAPKKDPFKGLTETALLNDVAVAGLKDAPGTEVNYSHLDMALLGIALARKSGVSYEMLAHSHVLVPLNMAAGYDPDGEVPSAGWNYGAYAPAMGFSFSAGELVLLLRAAMGIDDTELFYALKAMQVPRLALETKAFGRLAVGMGLLMIPTDEANRFIYWQSGITDQSAAFIAFHPEKRKGLVILTNEPVALQFEAVELAKAWMK